MPEVQIQRRQPNVPAWVWAVGALLLALVIGMIAIAFIGRDRSTSTPAQGINIEAPQVTPPGTSEALPVVVILDRPGDYSGQTVSGTVTVDEVVSDRGVWLRDGDRRIFAVIDEPTDATRGITQGQQIRLTGTVYDMQRSGEMPGMDQLATDTKQVVDQQPVFLYVRAPEIAVVDGQANGQAQLKDATRETLPVSAVLADDSEYRNKTISGTATVRDDVTDRGFWLEADGMRMFAIMSEPPEPPDLNEGQQVRVKGTVYAATQVTELSGEPIDTSTRQIAEKQTVFLYVMPGDIEIMGR